VFATDVSESSIDTRETAVYPQTITADGFAGALATVLSKRRRRLPQSAR